MIGSDVVARSAPDGTSLLVSANSLVAVPAIYGNAPYDWRTAFTPISHIQRVPAVLVVPPNSPIKTMADFIALGTRRQVRRRRFRRRHDQPSRDRADWRGDRRANTRWCTTRAAERRHAGRDRRPGARPRSTSSTPPSAISRPGKLRAIAVSSDKRVPQLPDVPTMKESGVKGLENFTFSTFTGLFGPAKMPPEVVAKLNDAMVKVLKDPAVVQRFAELTAEAYPTTPQETAAMFDAEDKMVVPLIKKLGIKAE